MCSYAGPIGVKEKTKLHCIISMEKDCIVQRIIILSFMDYRPSTFGVLQQYIWSTTTSRSWYQVKKLF